jgi:hypothetical protein
MDFIGRSFIEAGDVVSTFYTNTPGIKTDHILAFCKQSRVAPSDGAIAIQRRIQNVVSDERRQEMFNKWIEQELGFSSFTLDSRHLVVCPGLRTCHGHASPITHFTVEP